MTAVRASAGICQADVTGDTVGSRDLTFVPGKTRPGEYRFQIGSAGSASLVLPALVLANGPSQITVEGGTHNPMAPPFDFLEQAFVPLLNRMGPQVSIALERPGFHPAGGGGMDLLVTPSESFGPLELMERGEPVSRRVRALLAHLPQNIGQRECRGVLRELDWPDNCQQLVRMDDSHGPGNALVAELQFENLTEVFTAFGQRGKPAERVAEELVVDIRRYLEPTAPVGEHLADQLMLPMAIGSMAGNRRWCLPLARSVTTFTNPRRSDSTVSRR